MLERRAMQVAGTIVVARALDLQCGRVSIREAVELQLEDPQSAWARWTPDYFSGIDRKAARQAILTGDEVAFAAAFGVADAVPTRGKWWRTPHAAHHAYAIATAAGEEAERELLHIQSAVHRDELRAIIGIMQAGAAPSLAAADPNLVAIINAIWWLAEFDDPEGYENKLLKIEARLRRFARQLVRRHRLKIRAVAAALVERQRLSEAQVTTILRAVDQRLEREARSHIGS